MASQTPWIALLTMLLAVAALVSARDSSTDDVASVSLALSHDVADWRAKDTGRPSETRYTQADIELWSREIPGIEVGLAAGVGRLSQGNDAVTGGRSFTGHSLGLLARSHWSLTDNLGVHVRAVWTYHRADDDDIDFEWFDAYGRTGLTADAGRWRLGGGATVGWLRGERRQPGETRDLELDQNLGAYARTAIRTGRRGEISLSVETGPRRAVNLRFTRGF